ncbi:hypothetical protein FHR81_000949 [Actinoalloteichus hoggarensis]|uniref:Uncharacterized protein n=1 Tax=Actinoalloteichus hoggarensis TaxID=1470176 RepID=A0A221VYV2_9PSEU|nr:hypothetical protein [Actinoalloteichus hoggarensis]ASO18687.1 hypothetical protein AHOG_05170 [Actinoalloteichus hoggarensis]MBB5919919.1 hypothetical protein [Actinoalloteichus hoggarensis]
MSVTDVVAQLRHAHDLLTQARHATRQADAAITDGAAIFATATHHSTQPEIAQANDLATRSADDVRTAHALLAEPQDVIDGYCRDIAGHGINDGGHGVPPLDPLSRSDPRQPDSGGTAPVAGDRDPKVRYAEEIAELRRRGAAVDPDDVVRAERLEDGRIIWIENGNDRTGMGHVLLPDRVGDFAGIHIAREEIEDFLFAAVRHGTVVGHCGRDRPVYEVEYLGERRRVAISTDSDGKIYGANPISRKRKIRRDLHRK